MKNLKCDFHVHTNKDKEDMKTYTFIEHSPKEIIDRASRLGFDVLAIAHHNENYFFKDLSEYASKRGILLIQAIEKTIDGRHILFINVKNDLPTIKSLRDLSKAPRNSATILPHAYYPFANSLGNLSERYMKYIDAIEYHSMYFKFFNVLNWFAIRLAKKYKKPLIGNSDAHYSIQFNSTYSLIYANKNPPSIITAIKTGKIKVISKPISFLKLIKLYAWGLKQRIK